MAKKDNSGFVLPQIVDPPRKCVKIWIPNEVYHRGAFWGAIFELAYAYNWQQKDPEKARAVANLWFDIWSEATRENDGMTCCDTPAITYRVNPTTGNVEQSTNGGSTWTPAAGGIQSVIVQPVPPVTSGVAGSSCDAATNVMGQIIVWIDQVSNDFTTAVSLLEFGIAVLEAILIAVLTVLSAGALTPLEALVLPTLGAALAAAWGAGKAVFDAYWSTEVKDKILCAAVCNIGEDGSFTNAQFSAFWNKINADLPASPAKMLFMGFLSSVGKEGLNAMAASGTSADSDCGDCVCDDSCPAQFSVYTPDPNGYFGNVVERNSEEGWMIVETTNINTNGLYYIYIQTNDDNVCCTYVGQEDVSGTVPSPAWADCGTPRTSVHGGIIGDTRCVNALQWAGSAPYSLKVFFTPCV